MSSNTQVAGSCVQNFVIYAPLTHIEMNSNSQYCGALAGQSLHMDSNAQIFTDSLFAGVHPARDSPALRVSQFLDCSAASASPPNSRLLSGCRDARTGT